MVRCIKPVGDTCSTTTMEDIPLSKGARMLRTIQQKELVVGVILGLLLLCLVSFISAPHGRDVVSNNIRSAISNRQTLSSQTTSWHPNSILRAVSTQWSSLRIQSSLTAGDTKAPPKYHFQSPSYLKKLKQSKVIDGGRTPVDIASGVIDYDHLERNTVIVVGLSKYTEQDGVGLIGSVHIHMPFVQVIVYDLGMRTKTRRRVTQLCNVQVRNFDFSTKPSHVKVLRSNAWRLLVFVDCLQEFGSCFMAHPKIRFRAPLNILFPYIKETHGVFNVIEPDMSLFDSTHDSMLEFFRVEKKRVSSVFRAPLLSPDGFFVIMNSEALALSLPKLRTCAMKRDCISPRGSAWKGGTKTKKADEQRTIRHRFDMSAISSELYKAYGSTWAPKDGEALQKFKRTYTKIEEGEFGLELMWSFQCNPLKAEFDPSKIVR